MNELKLVKPDKKYKKSFLEFVDDIEKTGYETFNQYKRARESFEDFLNELDDYSKGINIESGWSPFSTFWLVKNIDVIGVIRVRHKLVNEKMMLAGNIGYEIRSTQRNKGYGSEILRLGLIEAKKLGLKSVIVTSNRDNKSSIKLINKYNLVLLKEFTDINLYQYRIICN